jgi:hypothetical protein
MPILESRSRRRHPLDQLAHGLFLGVLQLGEAFLLELLSQRRPLRFVNVVLGLLSEQVGALGQALVDG